jgi:hypothetical protein
MQGSALPGSPTGSPSAPAPPPQSGDRGTGHDSKAVETSEAVDFATELLLREGEAGGRSGQSASGWGPAPNVRKGGIAEVRVGRSLDAAALTRDLTGEAAGFGNQGRVITLPLPGAGKDEPSLAAPVAFVVLAHAWARSRVVSCASRARIPFTSTRGSNPLAIDRRPVGQRRERFFA